MIYKAIVKNGYDISHQKNESNVFLVMVKDNQQIDSHFVPSEYRNGLSGAFMKSTTNFSMISAL